MTLKRLLAIGTSLIALATASTAHAGSSWSFPVDLSIDAFVVPTSGIYDITAAGAQGTASNGYAGGLGASISVRLALTAGEQLSIAVGQYEQAYTINNPFNYNAAVWPSVAAAAAASWWDPTTSPC